MANQDNDWWAEIAKVIEERSLLKHPFYQAWQNGELPMDDLRHYARLYYPHVAHFPRYVSAVHSNTDDVKVRQMLLENLIEEERGTENHPELWLRFAEGLGLDRAEVLSAPIHPKTRACVDTFLRLTRDSDAAAGVAALYAYESQIPAVSDTKMRGLKDFYGVTDARSRAFFQVHLSADVRHSRAEREAVEGMARTPESREHVKHSVRAACGAVWSLLDGVMEGCKTTCSSN